MSLAKAILVGRVGSDPRSFADGKVVRFDLATTTRRKDSNGEFSETTQWFHVVCFSKAAEFATKYIHKGDPLYVEGTLQDARPYENKKGETVKEKEIATFSGINFQLLGSKKDNGTAPAPAPPQDPAPEITDEDVPF
jgi:single-strand DNA-binding protein